MVVGVNFMGVRGPWAGAVSVAGWCICSTSVSLHEEEAVIDGLQQVLRNFIMYARGCGVRRALVFFACVKKQLKPSVLPHCV